MRADFDKRKLMLDVCELNRVRESMYVHLPDEAHADDMLDAGRGVAHEVLKALAFGSSSRAPQEGVALLGVVLDDMLFAMQEAVRAL